MVDIEDALRRYREDRFTDDDVTRCSGLSVRALRELIKVGAIRTVTEGRGPGRVRLCDATVFKRAAVISALNQAGLNLAVAGRIAYFLPFHTLLYTVCDPLTIFFAATEPTTIRETGLPPRVQQPIVDWFDPDKPATANPETDWLIEIYDGHYVAAIYNSNATSQRSSAICARMARALSPGFRSFGEIELPAARLEKWRASCCRSADLSTSLRTGKSRPSGAKSSNLSTTNTKNTIPIPILFA